MPKTTVQSPRGAQDAIAAALKLDWKEAIRINARLVKEKKTDIDALNRLGFALLKSGQMTAARKTFEKALKLDPYNQIAAINSKRAGVLKRKDVSGQKEGAISPFLFLEEPGKTKIVSLVNTAPSHILQGLVSGQEVQLRSRNHAVEIRTRANVYLGVLPDDLSFKLLKLLSGGNQYQTHVKSIKKNSLTIIVRELSRGKRFAGQPTFTPSRPILPASRFVRTSDVVDITPTGEEEDTPQTSE